VSIAIVLGVAVGWLAYSRRAFLWTGGVVLVLLLCVQVIRFGGEYFAQGAATAPEPVKSRLVSSTVAEVEVRGSAQPTDPLPQEDVQPITEVKPSSTAPKEQRVVEIKPVPATPRDWKVCQGGDPGETLFVKDIVAACTRIIESKSAPNPSLIYARRGNSYDSLHDTDRAMQDLNEAIRLDPTFAWAFFVRSGVREKTLGDIRGAYDDSVRASDLDASYLPRRNYLVRTYGIREVVTSEADWIKSHSK
jgi:tetratricopeptide (TPR) repeat protein